MNKSTNKAKQKNIFLSITFYNKNLIQNIVLSCKLNITLSRFHSRPNIKYHRGNYKPKDN